MQLCNRGGRATYCCVTNQYLFLMHAFSHTHTFRFPAKNTRTRKESKGSKDVENVYFYFKQTAVIYTPAALTQPNSHISIFKAPFIQDENILEQHVTTG